MKAKRKTICGAVALVFLAVTFGGCWLFDREPRRNLERLLQGDGEVDMVAVTVSGHGQRIELSDAESMMYLTRAFRFAEGQGYIPVRTGLTYYAEMKVSRAGSVMVALSVPDDRDGLTVAYPVDSFGDPRYYWVPFPSPIPRPLSAALGQMRAQTTPRAGDPAK
jgi:hypothetical protein